MLRRYGPREGRTDRDEKWAEQTTDKRPLIEGLRLRPYRQSFVLSITRGYLQLRGSSYRHDIEVPNWVGAGVTFVTGMASTSSGPDVERTSAIDFAFAVATNKLSEQLSTADQVDAKLGVVIAALASVAALYSATAPDKVAALLFLILAAIAFIGYRAREWQNPPRPDALTDKYLALGKVEMQRQSIAVILEAYETNRGQLSRKATIFNWSLVATLVSVSLVLLISLALPSGK